MGEPKDLQDTISLTFYFIGGWLQVGNITLNDENTVDTIATNHIYNPSPISDLHKVRKSQFMLDPEVVQSLFKDGGYTEMKIKCHKTWHGRRVHVILSGETMIKYIAMKEQVLGLCGSVRFLSDDDSYLGNQNCQDFHVGYDYYNYFTFPIFKNGQYSVSFYARSRYDCDDYQDAKRLGNWQYYIR